MTTGHYLVTLDRDYDPNEPRYAVVEVSADVVTRLHAELRSPPLSARLLLDPETIEVPPTAARRFRATLAKLDRSPACCITASVANELINAIGVRCTDPELIKRDGEIRFCAFCPTVGERLVSLPLRIKITEG